MSLRFAAGVAGTIVLAGGAFFGGMKYGVQTTEAEHWRRRAAASDETLAKVRSLIADGNRLADAYEVKAAEIQTHTTTIIREVPRVLTPELDRRYPLLNGYVRLLDQAAGNSLLPPGAYGPDDSPSDVAPSEAATITALNYGACREDRARLIGLQEWARSVATEPDR